jgi:chemotaxis protein MotB
MAGKGGGSWKVAYADFVTAMMAFFLVMWIGAQDVKVRQSVANYFVDPSGVPKSPKSTGAITQDPNVGSVPKEGALGNSQGTRAAAHGPPSPTTKAVMNWLTSDPKRMAQWKRRADECLAEADAEPSTSNQKPIDRAAQKLATKLRAEFTANLPSNATEVFRDLIFSALNEVNWTQAADHVFDQSA